MSSVRPKGAGRLELLAPAGDRDCAFAALHYGADAVYLGLRRFSARADATNFDEAGLSEIVAFAHARQPPARVYVTFNTLVLEREWADALETLSFLEEVGADGVIVQDLGVARRVRASFPGLRLLASTQAAVHSPEGARAMRHLGFAGVLLARELTLEEIAAVAREGGLPVEAFVHGALCYSYSGLCLFSSHAYGRSGNRGRCASCCREPFQTLQGTVFPFSMKDLALGERLDDLRAAGVASLKIEGRLKNALYVAAVTDYYRRLLDGRLSPSERRRLEDDLRTIFSRPWTELHLDGAASADHVIDPRTLGHRGARAGKVLRVRRERDGDWLEFRTRRPLEKHDGLQVDIVGAERPFGFAVEALRRVGSTALRVAAPAGALVAVRLPSEHPVLSVGAPVYVSSSQAVKRAYRFPRPRPGDYRVRHAVALTVRVALDQVSASGCATVPGLPQVTAEVRRGGPFPAARNPAGVVSAIRKAFERWGDTHWRLDSLTVDNPDGIFVPISVWHDVRREMALALDGARDRARDQRIAAIPAPSPVPAAGKETWVLRYDTPPGQWAADADEIVLPLAVAEGVADPRLRIALPAILRAAKATQLRPGIISRLAEGHRRWEVGSLAGWQLLRECAEAAGVADSELDLTADWSLYTLNREAVAQLRDLGFRRTVTSPEDDGRNLAQRLRLDAGAMEVLIVQFTPLFMAATPPAAATNEFRGRRGKRYVELADEGLWILISVRPFSLTGHLSELRAAGARLFRCDLTRAAAVGADPASLWRAAREGREFPVAHEGNYKRGLT